MKTTEELNRDLAKLNYELAYWEKRIISLKDYIAEVEQAIEKSKYKPVNHDLTELEWDRYVSGHYQPIWNSKQGPVKVIDMAEEHLLNLLPYLLKRKFYRWHAVISARLMYLNAVDAVIYYNEK